MQEYEYQPGDPLRVPLAAPPTMDIKEPRTQWNARDKAKTAYHRHWDQRYLEAQPMYDAITTHAVLLVARHGRHTISPELADEHRRMKQIFTEVVEAKPIDPTKKVDKVKQRLAIDKESLQAARINVTDLTLRRDILREQERMGEIDTSTLSAKELRKHNIRLYYLESLLPIVNEYIGSDAELAGGGGAAAPAKDDATRNDESRKHAAASALLSLRRQ